MIAISWRLCIADATTMRRASFARVESFERSLLQFRALADSQTNRHFGDKRSRRANPAGDVMADAAEIMAPRLRPVFATRSEMSVAYLPV